MAVEEEPNLKSISSGAVKWIDIENPTANNTAELKKYFPFHPLNLEDCLSKRQLARVEDHGSYVFILLHFPSLGNERTIVRNQLSIFLGKEYVVTLHGSGLAQVSELFQALGQDQQMRSGFLKSSALLLHAILDKLVDGIFPVLDRIRDDLDDIEDEVFEGRVSSARSINRIRRDIADLGRIVLPLRRTVADTAALAKNYADVEDISFYFADVKDHVEKAWETLEEIKETAEIYKDSDFILSSEKTNRVLSVLTIIFTLSIPVTIVASIYGMNVPLPGGLNTAFPTFLGPFTSFILLMVAMIVPAAIMAWYFRRLGWL